jgi:hypothetical protein
VAAFKLLYVVEDPGEGVVSLPGTSAEAVIADNHQRVLRSAKCDIDSPLRSQEAEFVFRI